MEPITLAWAAEAMGARIVGARDDVVQSVCTDTRQAVRGSLFFALAGEHSDGHDYVVQAFAAGAVGAVASKEVLDAAGPLLIVPDTLRSLGDLAMHYRRQFAIPVVGVTGSVGKTSTKEMIATVLRTKYNTLASAKNFNNEIGVPMTLFGLTKAHEVAVIEMGMRGLGEIDRLAEIAQPTIGLITGIGYAHIERLGSQQNIAQAKSELLARLPSDGVAILPSHDPFCDTLRSRVPVGCRILTYDRSAQDTIPLQVIGVHHIGNAAAALAVASALAVPRPQAMAALGQWQGAEGRMVVRETPEGWHVLDDCYNAGPESMEAALATLAASAPSVRVAVLGDMRELGDFAPEAHRRVGRAVVDQHVSLLVTVGALAEEIANEARRYADCLGAAPPGIQRFAATEQAAANIRSVLAAEAVCSEAWILVKGSRAMEMEQIVAALTGEQNRDAHG
jgi:UDP-N-acetylmuramoyl-tripeptide--D-alanyl-D-alanine ligase